MLLYSYQLVAIYVVKNHKQSISDCSVYAWCLDHQRVYFFVCACLFQDVVNGYQCNCAVGWTGTNCDVDINDCSPSSCLNGGLCHVSCINIVETFTTLNH